jgi:hypothetical protein
VISFFYRKEHKELRKVRKVFLRQSFADFAIVVSIANNKNLATLTVKIHHNQNQFSNLL